MARLRSFFTTLHVRGPLFRGTALVSAYAALVSGIARLVHMESSREGTEIIASLGVVFGTLIVLRCNTANERWWEGRKLWGQLVNECRNLTLKAAAHVCAPASEKRELFHLLPAFSEALRDHLRAGGKGDATRIEPDLRAPAHRPGEIAGRVHEMLARWKRGGAMAEDVLIVLDVHARGLMDVCGGCERIRATPLPASYLGLFRSGLALYLAAAPWAMAADLGWWSIPVVAVAFFFLYGVELTAEALEEPFGTDGDDLPLDRICETIAAFAREADERVSENVPERPEAGQEPMPRSRPPLEPTFR